MNVRPNETNVTDLLAVQASAALDAITSEDTFVGGAFKRTREHWRDYGAMMSAKRVQFTSNNAFGRWVKDNGLDRAPANTPGVRSDAMWLADHWQEVDAFCLTPAGKTLHRPQHIRHAMRKAAKPDAPSTGLVGWTLVVEQHLGKMPKGFSRNTLAQMASKKDEVVAEYGHPIPPRLYVDSDEARDLAAAVQRCADRNYPNVALARAEQQHAEASAEVAQLPQTTQAKFERAVAKETSALRARFQHDFDAAVAAAVVDKSKSLDAACERASARHADYSNRLKTLDQWMTREEFKLVLGCLHPDRQPEAERQKYGQAFQIFKRLEGHLEPDGRVRRGRGW